MPVNKIFFDAKDHELLRLVNMILERDRSDPAGYADKLLDPRLHPHGIKALALSYDKRIAYAVINLLESLEAGLAEDRLLALRALHDEVLYGTVTSFRYNTGRVLIQIMKEIVRAHGDYRLQLKLAHDFRLASSGKRRVVRALLKRYYLLEMPEEWNQYAFDDHVHDVNTKGRKSPTHLIMDAWVKGIRFLKVIYYNHVHSSSAQELMRAAEIMRIQVRIGVEFRTVYRGRYVDIIWQPTAFADHRELAAFLSEGPARQLMNLGLEASRHSDQYIFSLLERYNEAHRPELEELFGITLPVISREEFLSFVGTGQPARLHLSELIYKHCLPQLLKRQQQLTKDLPALSDPARLTQALSRLSAQDAAKVNLFNRICSFSSDVIKEIWLSPEANPELPNPNIPGDPQDRPEIQRISTKDMTAWLTRIRASSRITLSLPGLDLEDVLELLYDCEGRITHLELVNLKYLSVESAADLKEINKLQLAINRNSPIALKRIIISLMRTLRSALAEAQRQEQEWTEPQEQGQNQGEAGARAIPAGINGSAQSRAEELQERLDKMREILRNIPKLQNYYRSYKLRSALGTDSTSRSNRQYGMGFVWVDTLPARARKELSHPDRKGRQTRRTLPIFAQVRLQVTSVLRRRRYGRSSLARFLARIPLLQDLVTYRVRDWLVQQEEASFSDHGNISTLGGVQKDELHSPCSPGAPAEPAGRSFNYLNTGMLDCLKVLIGFVAATLTFAHTQSWWVLAFFGAPIWFAITGFRNIAQALLGAGGFRRSPLMRWNNYISRTRISDSLFYTGLSVPLLELATRQCLLQGLLGVNSVDSPWFFFAVMATVNGIYIAGHNIFRGFPPTAVVGNLFRSILAVPLAILYNQLFILAVQLAGVQDPMLTAMHFSAILSKLSSDTVAGIIEGLADRGVNMRVRLGDYRAKITQLFNCFSSLELLLPEEESVLRKLSGQREGGDQENPELAGLERAIIIDSLDLLYFWLYQPRSRSALRLLFQHMTREELNIFCRSQFVLTRVKEVSQLFVDGILGKNFAQPLAFYLDQHRGYLQEILKLANIKRELPEN
ncbi:hypothetical protein LJC36_02040 [Desulfovibrio sp. OttesenSCG-928-C14]|nr:hypothetical protein [Desulfovibrio sp. OttesenSCG-928-C14]